MIPRNDCPDGPTRAQALAAVRSAKDKLDEAAEKVVDEIHKYVDAAKNHPGGEWDFATMSEPIEEAKKEMELFMVDLFSAQYYSVIHGHMSDKAELERAAGQCEISRLGRRP